MTMRTNELLLLRASLLRAMSISTALVLGTALVGCPPTTPPDDDDSSGDDDDDDDSAGDDDDDDDDSAGDDDDDDATGMEDCDTSGLPRSDGWRATSSVCLPDDGSNCSTYTETEPGEENCNGYLVDEDGDGLADCDDPDCADSLFCAANEIVAFSAPGSCVADGTDSGVECFSGFFGEPPYECAAIDEGDQAGECSDRIDNDGDGLRDCDEASCEQTEVCGGSEPQGATAWICEGAVQPMLYCPSLSSVDCGPDRASFDTGSCCFTVTLEESCDIGRPFLVDGARRLAGFTRRADWTDSTAPDLGGLSQTERIGLGEAWLRDAQAEHASVAAFARFAMQLLAQGAPAALVQEAQQAMADEIAHARGCFALASAYLDSDVGPGRLDISHAMNACSDEEIIRDTVLEGCIGETLAAARALAALEVAIDPVVAGHLERIAEEEARHSALAWRYLRWAMRDGKEELRREARITFRREIRRLRKRPVGSISRDELALRPHGVLPLAEMVGVENLAIDEVILPCMEKLFAEVDRGPRRGPAQS